MSTVLTAEKMHIQDAPRRLRFWRPDAAAKTFTLPAWALIVLTLIAPITIVIVMSFPELRDACSLKQGQFRQYLYQARDLI